MGSFFNLDGPFHKWGTELADVMLLSLLWVVCSLPIFTIGASTTALYYVFGKKVRGEDPYIFKNFFKSFKQNFKQATVVTLILGLLWFSVYLYYKIITGGDVKTWMQVMALFYMVQVTVMTLYIFPVLSRFEMTMKNLLLASFIYGNRHLLTTLICGALFIISILVTFSLTPFSMFAFGIYALVSSYFFQKVFTRHIENSIKEDEEDEMDETGIIDETDEQTVRQLENFEEDGNER